MNEERLTKLEKLTNDAKFKPYEVKYCDSTYLDTFNFEMTPQVAEELLAEIRRLQQLAKTSFNLYHEAMNNLRNVTFHLDMLLVERQINE